MTCRMVVCRLMRGGCDVTCCVAVRVVSSIVFGRVENVDTFLHHFEVGEEDHVDDARAED